MDKLKSAFNDYVALKYYLYNSIFLTLPYREMRETGILLSMFDKYCVAQIKANKHPQFIVDNFFKKNTDVKDQTSKINILFKMLQFVERQVVLFDALEDAAFAHTHNLNGPGSLHSLIIKVINTKQQENFIQQVRDYRVKIVLTAHPTQFYPDTILSIITQLTAAVRQDNLKQIRDLLLQMGKTSFKHRRKPTPYEEAESLIWYLENIFYHVIPSIQLQLDEALQEFNQSKKLSAPLIELGFWPGGDRDGNPNVTPAISLKVAKLLKAKILRLYVHDLRQLTKKLTFEGILSKLQIILRKLEASYLSVHPYFSEPGQVALYSNVAELLTDLMQLREKLMRGHDSLFLEHLDLFIIKVNCFQFYFAALDMRENSAIHHEVFGLILQDLANQAQQPFDVDLLQRYYQLNDAEKFALHEQFIKNDFHYTPAKQQNKLFHNTQAAIANIKHIQDQNGEPALCRYIISNTNSALDVLELLTMLHWMGQFDRGITVDIVPLFESIDDLENAAHIMQQLYQCQFYRQHLHSRHDTQTIMLGFSDGTKDGGYVAANWNIYKAKLQLTTLAKKHKVKIIFFDGRGGPPARGGGNTHHFYRSLGSSINHQQLQLTVQGQTISSNFGTYTSAKYNLEQLLTAGIEDLIFPERANNIAAEEANLLELMSQKSRRVYTALKNDKLFVPYLEEITPLPFYGDLNIGSRPATRKKSQQLQFADLRAIPFVGSWSQLKQNIPGYYGFGAALKVLIAQNKKEALTRLYQHSLFFRTLVENAMMSLCKTFFPLTSYMQHDKRFGKFWSHLRDESVLTADCLKTIAGQHELLENDPLNRESIKLREEITLPLLVIQQFAMTELKALPDKNSRLAAAYKELILKALATNTNASRNSA